MYSKKWTDTGKTYGFGSGNNEKENIRRKKPENIGNVDIENKTEIEKILFDFEKQAKNYDHEEALVILKNGEVWKSFGDEFGVWPDRDLGGIEALDGAIITHNHTRENTQFSFGENDISTFSNSNIRVLRGVDYKYRYVLSRDDLHVDEDDSQMWTQDYHHFITIEKAKRFGFGYRRYANDEE